MSTVIDEYSERNAKLVKGGVGLYAQERSDLFHRCIGAFSPKKKVAQIATLLKPEGVFVGTVPNGFSLLNRLRYLCNQPEKTSMAEPTHLTHFSVKRLRKALEAHFGQVRIYPIGSKKHAFLADLSPNLFAFCLAFECRQPK